MAVQRDLLSALLAYLAAEGVVRWPSVAGGDPPLWRDPHGGAPAPGERKGTANDLTTVLSVFRTGGFARTPDRGYSDRPTVDVRIRTKDAAIAPIIEKEISDLLAPPPYGVRFDWIMGGPDPTGNPGDRAEVHLIESLQWRPLQRLGSDPATGFDFVVSYLFELSA